MTADNKEKPQQSPQPTQPQDQQPRGTMFDPETIRKFIDQIKKDDK